MAAQFEAMTMTSPDKAAAIIHAGVDRGKARILVGPDAYLFDALARVAPTHYHAVLSRLQKRPRRTAKAKRRSNVWQQSGFTKSRSSWERPARK